MGVRLQGPGAFGLFLPDTLEPTRRRSVTADPRRVHEENDRGPQPTALYGLAPHRHTVDPNDVRQEWENRSGEYSPTYYAARGAEAMSDSIRDLLTHYVGTDARVLEIGCSSGRHLAHLHDAGFRDLHGIELNAESIDVMGEFFPELAEDGTFYVDDVGEVLPDFEDGAFDAVFSVETLQHIHPDDADRVFDEIARVTGDLLITVENESARTAGGDDVPVSYVNDEFPLYHRDWKSIFHDRGLAQLIKEPSKRDTLRAFRVPE